MFDARALSIAALFVSGAAFAQGQPGDANFCRQYAATVATAVEDATKNNPACLNPSSGVHADRRSHADWCLRTPSDKVEGASVHIRRLASKCTSGFLPAPSDYGGYAIMGSAQFEQPYGQTRGWNVMAAYSGRLFMYCVAETNAGGRGVRLGVDQAMPGDGSQWQLAVPVRANKDWQGRLEIDGQEPAHRAGADVSGDSVAGWAIAWLNMGQLDALKQGRQAVLGVGKQDYDFSLAGVAAAITKIEECRSRRGVVPASASASSAPQQMAQQAPAPFGSGGPAAQGAGMGSEPADLVGSIYRRAMTGNNVFDRGTRAQYLSRQIVRLIEQDEQSSRKRQEPGKLEYDLLSGGQDMLKIGSLQVAVVARQQDRASVRVRFRNTAFGNNAPVETVIYELQNGDQGWRITNIIYNAQHNLLRTLQPQQMAQQAPAPRNRGNAPAATSEPTEATITRFAAAGPWTVNSIKAGRRTIACEAIDASMPNLRFEIDRDNAYIDFKDGGAMGAIGARARVRVQFGPGSSPNEMDVTFIEGRDGDKWARIIERRTAGPGLLDDSFQNSSQVSFRGRNIILERPITGSKRALDAFFRCSNEIK